MAESSTEAVKAPSVYVRHLSRDPLTRTERRLRPTNRLGFILDNGQRIRRKNRRSTELDIKTVEANLERLVDGVKLKYIEISDTTGSVMSVEDLRSFVGGKPAPAKTQVKSEPASEPDPEPAGDTEMETAPDTQLDESAPADEPEEGSKPKKNLFGRKSKGKKKE